MAEPIRKQLTQEIVDKWIEENAQDWVTTKEMDVELNILTPEAKTYRRVCLHRRFQAGQIEKHLRRTGVFRLANNQAPIIDWQSADVTNIVDLKWPFGLEKWVTIYPKNIIVVAGSYNAGKTAFCLDFIRLNQHRAELGDLLPIQFFSSEMGPEEMKVRRSKFGVSDWADVPRERSAKFAEVIQPDKINIVDYLEVTDNFYLVAQELTEMFNNLKGGVVLVTLQKKRGEQFEMGRGAEFSLEKPRLYLSMDSHKLKITKAKNWAQEGLNPNGMEWKFKLIKGAIFKIEEE